jgi:predicted nucleic acid-binding protein
MSDKTFIDSNVLIYAHDVEAGSKHVLAKQLLLDLWSERSGVLSLQVLQEFYSNVTRKIPVPLAKTAARSVVNSYASWSVETTTAEILAAFHVEDEARVGFWDALIVAAAKKSGASRIWSEDLNSQQIIAGIRIENPFVHIRRQ